VYARNVKGKTIRLGVSGRLLDFNLVMWDPETDSLWSQMTGKALYGPAKKKGLALDVMPSLFVSFSMWKALHPKTDVLDLPPIRSKGWHFTTKTLMKGKNRHGDVLGLAVEFGGDAVAVSYEAMRGQGVVQPPMKHAAPVFVWLPKYSSAVVYDARLEGKSLHFAMKEGLLVDASSGRKFDPLTGKEVGELQGASLVRLNAMPAVLDFWKDAHAAGRVVR